VGKLMRFTQAEKLEIIRLVETSALSVAEWRRSRANEKELNKRKWKSDAGSIDKASRTGYIGTVNPLLF
jgi:hypothetical protein